MKAFDAFVMSSTQEEAFGLVLLEAMAASVPLISCDAPGPRSVVGDTALLFRCDDARDLTDKMRFLRQQDRAYLETMTQGAIARLGEEFSVPVMQSRLRSLPPLREHLPLIPEGS